MVNHASSACDTANHSLRYDIPSRVTRLIWSQSHFTLLILGLSRITKNPSPPSPYVSPESSITLLQAVASQFLWFSFSELVKRVSVFRSIPSGLVSCIQISFKDVRAHCYCTSLVRTLYMTWHVPRHVFQARAPSRNLTKYRA